MKHWDVMNVIGTYWPMTSILCIYIYIYIYMIYIVNLKSIEYGHVQPENTNIERNHDKHHVFIRYFFEVFFRMQPPWSVQRCHKSPAILGALIWSPSARPTPVKLVNWRRSIRGWNGSEVQLEVPVVHCWLVVQPPLWKIWTSIGMIRNPIYGTIKNGNQTTNQTVSG